MNKLKFKPVIVTILMGTVIIWCSASAVFLLKDTEWIGVFDRTGLQRVVLEAGFHLKKPFSLDRLVHVTKQTRILDSWYIPNQTVESILKTNDGQTLTPHWQIFWRVNDPNLYLKNFNPIHAKNRTLTPTVDGATGAIFLQTSMQNTLQKMSSQYSKKQFQEKMQATFNDKVQFLKALQNSEKLQDKGILLMDVVWLGLIESPEDQKSTNQKNAIIYQKNAENWRDETALQSKDIQAKGQLLREQKNTASQTTADEIRSNAENEAINIYAASANKNPEFANFVRALDAYKNTFNSKTDVVVVNSLPLHSTQKDR